MLQKRPSWEEQKKTYEQRKPHYWKDMEVGQEFGPFIFPITEDLVKEIMEVTGDEKPLYLVESAAKAASFSAKIAPQATTMIFGRLSYLGDQYRPAPGGALLGISFWFVKPPQVGDIITSRAKVTQKEEKKGRKIFTLRAELVNQNGEVISIVEQSGMLPL